nr:ECF transporter S component [Clostridium oryzae]
MQLKKQKSSVFSVRDLVFTSLMAALIFIATFIIQIPTPNKGYIHLGDTMVFVAAVLLGKKKGFAAAAIGMMLADLASGYATWAPFTFIIKGVMALIAASIALRGEYNGENPINNVFAFTVAGIWMIVGYYFAGAAIMYLISGTESSLAAALIASTADVLGNIIQAASGIILASILLPIVTRIYKHI